eukprot:SAG11_NODE_1721_length_4374_cov_5.296374_3_plen_149_part_00
MRAMAAARAYKAKREASEPVDELGGFVGSSMGGGGRSQPVAPESGGGEEQPKKAEAEAPRWVGQLQTVEELRDFCLGQLRRAVGAAAAQGARAERRRKLELAIEAFERRAALVNTEVDELNLMAPLARFQRARIDVAAHVARARAAVK